MKKTITLSILTSLVCSTFWAQQGLQITSENFKYTVNFETEFENVNFGEFKGLGFVPNNIEGSEIPGTLDSDTWEVQGMSDGNLNFGDSSSSGDFARGLSSVPVGIGGIYSFEVYPDENILGIQANTADATPGSIGMRVQNKTGTTITSLKIEYVAYTYNDQPGSGYFSMSHSADHSTFTEILQSNIITPNAPSPSPTWVVQNMSFKITGLNIAVNEFYYVRWNIKNTGVGELDQFGIDDISFTANPSMVLNSYVYNDNEDGNSTNDWTPSDPNLAPENLDTDTNVSIQNGTALFSEEFSIGNLTVASGATLRIQKPLLVQNGIENNGSLIFESTSSSTGQLGNLGLATFTGSGNATVERYIPARDDGKGAYRYLTSAVNTTGSIQANWQEGAASMANPNPGYGMFITGVGGSTNGFDQTPANPPSMFTFNASTQQYIPVTNTNSNQLMAGEPYSVYVWGDRSVDILTTNDPVATSTTLRATGNLLVGDQDMPLDGGSGNFNMIGNPYQASVNMHDVMTLSTNVNPNVYYVWDPNLGTRGAYTTVDLNNGTNSTSGVSEANQYLMPGQAAWVVPSSSGAILHFTEDTKNAWTNETDVFRPETSNTSGFIGLQLFQAERFENGESLSDAIRVNFVENEDNGIQPNDAPKLFNIDENLAFSTADQLLSIAYRDLPVDGELLPISTTQYRSANYVFNAIVSELPDGTRAYLKDNYLGIQTELANNASTPVSFGVDANNIASKASDRFAIVFERSPLGVDEESAQSLSIYPNPVQDSEFFIAAHGISGEKVQVSLFNVLGQEVYRSSKSTNANQRVSVPVASLKAGVYVVKLELNGKTLTGKVVVQ
ncbi:MAG TPA: T9SS type A sorting domain-containing protein [Flavobacteriaceae bacterium]|nr:T9SS type A sorting domain-containing protein [Flavobacteriaceae bacterium]